MPHKSARLKLPPRIAAARWAFGGGTLRLRVVGATALRAVDATWPARRLPSDISVDWRWASIALQHRLTVAVTDQDDEVLVLWSTAAGVVTLKGEKVLRVDRLECNSAVRGQGYGTATIVLLVAVARELGATGLIFAIDAQDEATVRFYRDRLQAEVNPVDAGWKCEHGLVPCRIRGDRFVALVRVADDSRVKGEGKE